jgi:hypothetical protein
VLCLGEAWAAVQMTNERKGGVIARGGAFGCSWLRWASNRLAWRAGFDVSTLTWTSFCLEDLCGDYLVE